MTPEPIGNVERRLVSRFEIRIGPISVASSVLPRAQIAALREKERRTKPETISTSFSAMAEAPIVVLDSGIGGLPYLARIRELLPGETLAYVADNAHFPYGDRRDDEVIEAVLQTGTRVCAELQPKVLVLACNTASVLALDGLREVVKTPVVGVVPAVKPACEESRSGVVGVLATERTVSGGYLDDLVRAHCNGCRVVRRKASHLVRYVELELYNPGARTVGEVVSSDIDAFVAAGADRVVLGCTHFLHVISELTSLLGSGCRVVDSREGVARQVVRVNATLPPGRGGESKLFVTDATVGARYRRIARRFGVDYAGSL
jgi:glutamate racemase